MTVVELIEKLKQFPPDMEVVILNHEFDVYGRVGEILETSVCIDPLGDCFYPWNFINAASLLEKKIVVSLNE